MRWFTLLCCAALAGWFTPPAWTQEQPAKGKIISVGLFKNGLAVVKQRIEVAGPGTYRLDDVPEPVHGTWWVEGGGVETSVEMREFEAPDASRPTGNLQEDLAGNKVRIHLKGGKLDVIEGTVLKFADAKDETPRGPGRFLIVKSADARVFVDTGEIAAIAVVGAENKTKQKKAVLLLHVDKAVQKPLIVTYLTRGLAWASSYRIDISDPKNLKVELSAVIRNELADLKQAEVKLISGFPSVQFSHVTSPLSPKMSWNSFFQSLTSGRHYDHDLLLQRSLSNTRYQEVTPLPLNLAANPTGEGVDLHYQSIGKRTLAKGDALALTVAQSKANYERIIEWIIPDNRDDHGRYHARDRNADEDLDEPWDALRFKNPFTFPMTTSPALVVSKGQFNGQRTCFWTNAGEATCLRVTKALSVRTRNTEQEIVAKNGDPEIAYVGGNRYRRATIAGEVTVSNHRAEDVKMLIRRRFSGELVNAEGNPKTLLREEGAYSVNRRNELTWTVALKGGEDTTLQYRYRVLVSH